MIDVSSNFLSQVSKPIMEKKRRARINKCLDQLKSLLESYYSTSVSAHRLELKKLRIGFDIFYIPILNRFSSHRFESANWKRPTSWSSL